jgi:hypothetical protein
LCLSGSGCRGGSAGVDGVGEGMGMEVSPVTVAPGLKTGAKPTPHTSPTC